MFKFLLVVQALVAFAMIVVILMQRSEGGGLGMGGSPSGLMSARGAADFLTRSTTILATLFVILSIVLAGLAAKNHATTTIDTSLTKSAAPATAPLTIPQGGGSSVPLQGGSVTNDPLAEAAKAAGEQSSEAPAKADEAKGGVPIQQ